MGYSGPIEYPLDIHFMGRKDKMPCVTCGDSVVEKEFKAGTGFDPPTLWCKDSKNCNPTEKKPAKKKSAKAKK